MRLATRTVLSTPYRRTASRPCSPSDAAWRGRPSIVSTSVSETYACTRANGIVAAAGQLECSFEASEALVAAAEVGEVAAQLEAAPTSPREPSPTLTGER